MTASSQNSEIFRALADGKQVLAKAPYDSEFVPLSSSSSTALHALHNPAGTLPTGWEFKVSEVQQGARAPNYTLRPFYQRPIPEYGQQPFTAVFDGIELDCLISGDSEDGIEVCTIWHLGADFAELFAQSLDARIIEYWLQHCSVLNDEARIP